MSRKAFSSDLDSVFAPGAQYEPNIDATPWLVETAVAIAPEPLAAQPAKPKRLTNPRRGRKTFSSNLDSLFAMPAERPAEQPARVAREAPRRSLSILGGIDALIRDTTDGRAIAQEDARLAEAHKTGVPKRVTFTYDRDQFARLKQIAREEGAYLKDIISGLLNDYLDGRKLEGGSLAN